MSMTETSRSIWVNWPGGKLVKAPIPTGAKEIEVAHDGTVTRVR